MTAVGMRRDALYAIAKTGAMPCPKWGHDWTAVMPCGWWQIEADCERGDVRVARGAVEQREGERELRAGSPARERLGDVVRGADVGVGRRDERRRAIAMEQRAARHLPADRGDVRECLVQIVHRARW